MFASLHTATLATRRVHSGGSLSRLARKVHLGMTTWRQRQTLVQLEDWALADIGLTRAQAVAEAEKPVWDVPKSWLR